MLKLINAYRNAYLAGETQKAESLIKKIKAHHAKHPFGALSLDAADTDLLNLILAD